MQANYFRTRQGLQILQVFLKNGLSKKGYDCDEGAVGQFQFQIRAMPCLTVIPAEVPRPAGFWTPAFSGETKL